MRFLFWPYWPLLRELRAAVDASHRDLRATLLTLVAQGNRIMSALDDLKAVLGRIDTATSDMAVSTSQMAVAQTNIAEDIRVIKEGIKPVLTPAEVEELKALAEATAVKAETQAAALKAQAASLDALDAENPTGAVEPPPA